MIIEFMLTLMFGIVFGLTASTVYSLGKKTGENEVLVRYVHEQETLAETRDIPDSI